LRKLAASPDASGILAYRSRRDNTTSAAPCLNVTHGLQQFSADVSLGVTFGDGLDGFFHDRV
jgi:hypothetical protein